VVQNREEPPFAIEKSSFVNFDIPAGMVSKADGALLRQHANESAALTTGVHASSPSAFLSHRARTSRAS
jgi:hypothetical protein